MKARLTFQVEEASERHVDTPERRSVMDFRGLIDPGEKTFDLSEVKKKLSVYFHNQGSETNPDSNQTITLEALNSEDLVIQRQVVYANRTVIFPLEAEAQGIRLTSSSDTAFSYRVVVF